MRSTARPRVVDIAGRQHGLWIVGRDHEVFYVGLDRRRERGAPYSAGNTLVWNRAGITYRLEGALTFRRALDLAGSL